MVAFITLLSATATLFLACTNVLANPTPDNSIPSLLARQSAIDTSKLPAACKSSCEAVVNTFVNADCDTNCKCKDATVDVLGSCYTCSAAQDATFDVKGAQSAIDDFVKSCKASGSPVKSTNISGGKNGAMRLGALGSGAIGVMALGAVFSLA